MPTIKKITVYLKKTQNNELQVSLSHSIFVPTILELCFLLTLFWFCIEEGNWTSWAGFHGMLFLKNNDHKTARSLEAIQRKNNDSTFCGM